jgi:hypothetical protein
MDLIQGAMAILSGGATGLLGVVAQRLFDHWKIKQENERLLMIHKHDLDMKAADTAHMKEEWAQRTKVAAIEADAKVDASDAAAFAESFKLEPKLYSEGLKPAEGGKWAKGFQNTGWLALVFVDAVRGIVRPGLTIYLCWITTQMYDRSTATLALIDSDPAQHAALLGTVHSQIVFTILYLFTTCVCWWFGTRNKQKPPKAA